MTLADDFASAPHERKIAYLNDVLRDFEGWFLKDGFITAVRNIQQGYGSQENLEVIFSYIVKDELHEQSIKTARAFIHVFTIYYQQLKKQVESVPVIGPTLVAKFFPF